MSETGIAGLTLGGELKYLARKYGLTHDSLRSMDVVTADGDLVTVSADENPDLFGDFVEVPATSASSHRSSSTSTNSAPRDSTSD